MALDLRELNVGLPALPNNRLLDDNPQSAQANRPWPPKPTVESVQRLAANLQTAWGGRNRRLETLENLYRLKHNRPNPGEHITAMPDPALMVNKVAARLGTATLEEQVNAASELEVSEEAAQREELFDHWWLDKINDIREESGRGKFQYETAFMGAHRGAIADVLLPDPTKPKFPWQLIPLDWANVYPSLSFSPDRPILCIAKYNADELHSLFPENQQIREMGLSAEHTLTYYYDTVWMGILMDDGTVLKPFVEHDYGYNPCILTLVGGSPVRSTPWDVNGAYLEHVGMPLLDPLIEWIEEFDKILSEAYSHHAKAFAPPLAIVWDKENHQVRSVEIDTSPNAVNNLPVGVEDVKIWNPGALSQETQFLSSVFQSRLNRLIPAISFGEVEPNQSGYSGQVARASSNDAFFPHASAVASHTRRILTRVKSLMANDRVGLSPVMIASQGRAIPYTPQDAKLETEKVINLADVTPQDLALLRAKAIQANQRGLLNIKRAQELGKFTSNPKLAMREKLRESIYMSPEVLKVEIAKALGTAEDYARLMAFTSLTEPPKAPGGQAPPAAPMQPGSQAIPPEAMGMGHDGTMPMISEQEPMPQVGSGGRGPY